MYRAVKILHLLAFAVFLGSVFSHIIAGIVGGEIGGAAFLAARQQIDAATRDLTLPSLGLAIVSGGYLALLSPARRPWMGVHGALAVGILSLAVLAIVPAGRVALVGAAALAHGHGDIEGIQAALLTERIAGVSNILMTLVAVALAVYKPALRAVSRRDPRSGAEHGEM